MKQTVSLECHMANPCSFLLVVIRRAAALAAVLLITGLMAVSADAQTNSTWNGGAGDWGVSTNWNPAVVPNNVGSTTYSVTISAPSSHVSMLLLNETIDNLSLGATDRLSIVDGGLSLVSGVSSNNGSMELDFSNLSINSGAGIINNGSVSLSGDFFGGGPTLNNSGTFINNFALSLQTHVTLDNTSDALFANSGTITADATLLSNEGTFNNIGTIGLTTLADPSEFSNSGTFNNSGTINVT
jgi:hypothetical protein